MAKVLVVGTGGDDEGVTGQLPTAVDHPPVLDVKSRHFPHERPDILSLAEDLTQWHGNVSWRETGDRHLVKEREEEVIILLIDQGHINRDTTEALSGVEAAKAAAHDHYPRSLGHCFPPWLGSDTRFGLDHHIMLFEAAFTRVRLLGQGMLMGQTKILAADPSLEGRLVAPRGQDHIGRRRIGRAEYLQAHKAWLLVDLTCPGSEPFLELLTPGRCDWNTVGNNVHVSSSPVVVDDQTAGVPPCSVQR